MLKEKVFFEVAPLIKTIKISNNFATIYANHEIDPVNKHKNSTSLSQNLNQIRYQLRDVITPMDSTPSCTLTFSYTGSNKAIIDALMIAKKRFEALNSLQKNGGLSISNFEQSFFDARARTQSVQSAISQRTK